MALLKITIEKKSTSIPLLVFAVALFFLQCEVFAQSQEYQLKAVFLFNFTQFVDWPEDAFQDTASPLVIGILGEDPFGSYLDQTVAGERAKTHPLVVKHPSSDEEIKDCHILFINIVSPSHLKAVVESVKGQNILTVSDVNNFSKIGGVIRLYTENNKIRIRINLDAAKENKLAISSKLLKLADVVESK